MRSVRPCFKAILFITKFPLANGDSILSPKLETFWCVPPITDFPTAWSLQGKRQKRGGKKGENLLRAKRSKMEGKMKRKETKRKEQQGYDVEKVIDTIEKTAAAAVKIYRAIEAILKMITTRGKTR